MHTEQITQVEQWARISEQTKILLKYFQTISYNVKICLAHGSYST